MISDVYRPVGAWRRENNGTFVEDDGKYIWHEYPPCDLTPALMKRWMAEFGALLPHTRDEALLCYAKAHLSFVSIHPFFDGNGRMARLLANFPLLRSGFPPIVIQQRERRRYLSLCHAFQKSPASPFPTDAGCRDFVAFLDSQWCETWEIIDGAHRTQAIRRRTSEAEVSTENQKLTS